MLVTNDRNLPAPLVAAVSPTYQPKADRISVTALIGPPQIRLLTLLHWDELSEDASARIWATMGGLMHQLLANHAGRTEGHQSERRLETLVEGFTVTGAYDLLHEEDGTLTDYKFVSVYTTMDGIKPEWVEQLNVYAELVRRSGGVVNRLQVVAIYRDWSKGKAFGHGYPQAQVQTFNVPLWTPDRAAAFIVERVRLHAAAQAGGAVECTPAERWARPTKWALMKGNNKRAVKLFDDEASARAAVKEASHHVQERPGANVRCASYCAVAAFCPQYAALRATQSDGEGDEEGGQ